MLINLHVKNLALIDEADIFFDEGLNIITGETGAGKSLLLGSINLALGAKSSKDMIGNHGDFASVELLFQVDDECVKRLSEKDIYISDNQVLISRKFTENKNIMKINGENVTLATVRSITSYLIDIHGQHEHQSLLYPSNHLIILDRFGKNDYEALKNLVKEKYSDYKAICSELDEFVMPEDERKRKVDFLEYEINEIESSELKKNEDEELEQLYKKLKNSQKIAVELSQAKECINSDSFEAMSSLISRAYKAAMNASVFDESLNSLVAQFADIESLINDLEHELNSYLSELEFDEAKFDELEKRLDYINNLKAKYGNSYEQIMEALDAKKCELQKLVDYEERRSFLENKKQEKLSELLKLCSQLTIKRKEAAKVLQEQISKALSELNFLNVDFSIDFRKLEKPSSDGMDYVEYMISVNPGEERKPLSKVASGGELSRIMLAIKTVLADKDDIDTLLFDEIDTGISGKTAQLVANKMSEIGQFRQVLCITHLPQIAAMADKHFEIHKDIVEGKTVTSINELNYDESVHELARILGGEVITDNVINNAKELKKIKTK